MGSRTWLTASALVALAAAFGACGSNADGGGGTGGVGDAGESRGGDGVPSLGGDGPTARLGRPATRAARPAPSATTACACRRSLQCVTNARLRVRHVLRRDRRVRPLRIAARQQDERPGCKLVVAARRVRADACLRVHSRPRGRSVSRSTSTSSRRPIVVNFNRRPDGPSATAEHRRAVHRGRCAGGYTENLGVIRILKGTDCTLQANLGGIDLDGDGAIDWANSSVGGRRRRISTATASPRSSSYMGDRTTVAFTRKNERVEAALAEGEGHPRRRHDALRAWPTASTARARSGTSLDVWSAPSIHDLDDDGVARDHPRGLRHRRPTGKAARRPPADYATLLRRHPAGRRAISTAIRRVALTNGAHVWEFDGKTSAWIDDAAYRRPSTAPGWTGIADFNPYDGKKQPEIVVARRRKARRVVGRSRSTRSTTPSSWT